MRGFLSTAPAFAAIIENPFGLFDIGSDTAPALADLDGDYDILSGEISGNLYYFKNIGNNTSPIYDAPLINTFGLTNVGVLVAPSIADLNGEGLLDVLVGTAGGNTYLFKNNGTLTVPSFASAEANPNGLINYTGLDTSPGIGDLDGDGDKDILLGERDGSILYFENTGSASLPAYTTDTSLINPFEVIDIPNYSFSAMADLDNDGDLDILTGSNNGHFHYVENVGSSTQFIYGSTIMNPFGIKRLINYNTPFLADLDSDGDFDLLSGFSGGLLYFFNNTGTPSSPAFATRIANPFGLTSPGSYSAPVLADLDNDGDLDLLAGNIDGNFIYFQNIGSKVLPAYTTAITNPFNLTDIGGYAHLTIDDLDADGDLDVLAGNAIGDFIYFENIGNPVSPMFELAVSNPFGLFKVGGGTGVLYSPLFADVDADGDLDVLVGNKAGTLIYFRNTPLTPSPTPSSTLTVTSSISPSLTESISISGSVNMTPSSSVTPSSSIAINSSVMLSSSSSCATTTIEKVTNQLTIRDGQTVVYTPKFLQADLPGCTPAEIKYTVEQVSHGQFERTKGKFALRDKDAIASFTQADVDAGTISFEHDGSNQKPSYTLGITNGVVSKDDKGDIKFIPRAQQSTTRTAKPTAKLSNEDSSASRLSVLPELSTSLILGMVLAKMSSNALASLVSAGKRWWHGEAQAAASISAAENKQAQASFERLQTQIEHLLSQKGLNKWYCYSLEDLSDELNDANVSSLTLAQIKEWQEDLGELEAEYAPPSANSAVPIIHTRISSFFKPVIQAVVMPEQPAALPAMAQRHIAA